MDYTIRFAKKDDTEEIMEFIDRYWRKDHILSRNKTLFDWQYGNADSDRLNIVLGIDENGDIQGMLGFVPYDTGSEKDIALALWKANPSTGFLGIKLIMFLFDNEPHREVVCPGINMDTTSKIYEHLGMSVGAMKQWYRLREMDDYKIAKVTDPTIPAFETPNEPKKLTRLDTINDFDNTFDYKDEAYAKSIPLKSRAYIEKRYYDHPIYKYILYAASYDGNTADSVFVFRVQECNGSRALRMIDCIGNRDSLRMITGEIDRLLKEYDCEYIDVYEVGISDDVLEYAGWRRVEDEGNIIPDYFSPFEHRKVDIHYSISNADAVLFKGDGDQDRPN